ncbi:hypothetical protein A5886_001114 [Enterococcus sp. 8G7_MSG3316]|uniref:Prepilin-type N-terminal cleavage/methylation domain-containing protein n=1 Tax=Candidatus Enterococcus testudinis TaxID=1834191 RepID=A0A242A4S3_9ENTE|nr:prepilin-type N-terminal cleavage/methylation domain-containing protein [Enterococcus sp. 8G7_MSG3316]OTN76038.1 hypothetical protein A5886_001114 [Enterococcus sp. 8G7_MSG3316]
MIDAILVEETTENRFNKLMKDERGLSLVELLAVVVILAIIAGIGVIAIGNVIQNTREDAAVADVQQAYSAAVLYLSTNRSLNDGKDDEPKRIFTLEEVMEDNLLNSTSWTGTDTVEFYIGTNGDLTMYVPDGVLMAGQIPNDEVGAEGAGQSQNEINALTRDKLFNKKED